MQAPDDSTRIGATIAAQTRELHLGQHLGSRFWQVVSPLGAANTPSRRALAVACGSLDLASSRWIGPPRRHLGAQVVIDLADLALWATLANDEPESSRCAFIPGASLAAELAARWRWRAAALPLAHLAVAGLVRRRRGHRLRLGQVGWQLWGVVGSVGLAEFGRWRRKRALERHMRILRPALVSAEIAGMNSVVLSADNVLDAAQRATILVELTLGKRGEFTGALDAGAVKQKMAALTRSEGGYLGDVLLGWQAVRNSSADLARVVSLEVDLHTATRVLSATQVATVQQFLDHVSPCGVTRVSLNDTRLNVGGGELVLQVVPEVPSLYFDPLPIALLMHAAWMAAPTGAAREQLRWSSAALPVGIAGLASIRTAQQATIGDQTQADRRSAVAAAGVSLALYTVLSPRGMGSPMTPEGVPRYPFTQALQGYLMILRLADSELNSSERRAALSLAVAAMLIGLSFSRRPWSLRHLAAELVWPLTTSASSAQLASSIDADSDLIRHELEADDQARCDAAFGRGRATMLAVVESCVSEASRAVNDHLDELDHSTAEEARRRLQQVGEELAKLMATTSQATGA